MRRERAGRGRRALSAVLLTVAGTLAVACGSASPGTFHPGGVAATGAVGAGVTDSAPPGWPAAQHLAWPPFGTDVHVVMPVWLPADSRQVPAVITVKDFLLAFLYAEYRGNQDDRWTGYVSGSLLPSLKSTLAAPGVTTESFTGTIGFSHMRAFPDPTTPGNLDVSECFDNSHSNNTDLVTGKVISAQPPPSQRYYRNTDVLAPGRNGQWRVVSVYPVVYYPQAKECKP
jgi:hypothetical protein